MQQPLIITIKDIPASEAIEDHIRKKIEKLTRFYNDIISCHVVVELSQKSQHQGQLHDVHIKMTVPGKELIATRNASENLWISIRDACLDIGQQLKNFAQHLHRQVKNHPIVFHGEIVRLFDDYGFILGPDGLTEYYFNSGTISHPKKFDKLRVGMPVHFIEFIGNEGYQARRVTVTSHEIPLHEVPLSLAS